MSGEQTPEEGQTASVGSSNGSASDATPCPWCCVDGILGLDDESGHYVYCDCPKGRALEKPNLRSTRRGWGYMEGNR